MKRVGELVGNREVYSVQLTSTVAEVARYMSERRVGAVSVLDGEKLVGIFSERDLLKRVVAARLDPARTAVSEVMSRDVLVADASDSATDCLEKMRHAHIRHLPVFSDGRLFGLVTMRDLMMHDLEAKGHELQTMRSFIATST